MSIIKSTTLLETEKYWKKKNEKDIVSWKWREEKGRVIVWDSTASCAPIAYADGVCEKNESSLKATLNHKGGSKTKWSGIIINYDVFDQKILKKWPVAYVYKRATVRKEKLRNRGAFKVVTFAVAASLFIARNRAQLSFYLELVFAGRSGFSLNSGSPHFERIF